MCSTAKSSENEENLSLNGFLERLQYELFKKKPWFSGPYWTQVSFVGYKKWELMISYSADAAWGPRDQNNRVQDMIFVVFSEWEESGEAPHN